MNAVPDSAYHPDADCDVLFDADPDQTFHPDADPDPDPAYKLDADPDFYLMRMRIQDTKMIRILANPDPHH